MCWHVYIQALLKMTGAYDDSSLGGAFDGQIQRYGRVVEHYFGPRGREIERSNLPGSCLGLGLAGVEVSS